MNRLRAGKILSIPEKDAVAAVAPSEAHKIVIAQAAEFNAYRKKLAAAAATEPAQEAPPKQVAAGKITPKIEEKTPPAPAGKDKLEVSRAETGKGAKAGTGAAEEDLVARDKALKEANARIAMLEKNVADLKKLADMKSAAGAKAQEPPPVVPKPAEAAKPAAPVLTVPAKPLEAPKPAPVAPAPAATSPAVKLAAPPPSPPPSFVDENPEIVLGGGAILALLLGYLGYSSWRKKHRAAAGSADVAVGELASSSVFGTVGGQSVDTGAALPTDFSQQPGSGASGDEGVDPVAEADVYIAYGRDTQAEEILLEALKADPKRCAIHLKLLEIYAVRKSVQAFEGIARELHGLSGGKGPDWDKAATLGRAIDPANPLYGGGEAPAANAPPNMAATVITTAAALQTAAVASVATPTAEPSPSAEPAALDFDLDLGSTPAAAAPGAELRAAEEAMSLDFDLGATAEVEAPAASAINAEVPGGLDFELDTPTVEPTVAPAAPSAEVPGGLDFELDTPAVEPTVVPAAPSAEAPAGGRDAAAAFDFDFDLSEPAAAPAAAPAPVADAEMPALDLAGISLELDEPSAAAASASPAAEIAPPAMPQAETPSTTVADDPEVATKLELAQAYEEMGDKEGALELLNEVLNEGSPSQQKAARSKLAELA